MSNDAELIESTIQTIAHLTHSSNALQDKLRANAASGECAKSTNLTMIAAADRIDELERQLAEAQKDQADAKRYRWLRDAVELPLRVVEAFESGMGETLDMEIDYAVGKEAAQQKVSK